MSSPTPAQRATAAHRLEFAMRELELAVGPLDGSAPQGALTRLREEVDSVQEVLTR